MKVDILSIFSEKYFAPLQESILKKAQDGNFVKIVYHNLRDYTHDVHRTVDDRPYGGGPGMIFKPEPLYDAINDIYCEGCKIIYPSPRGIPLCQKTIDDLRQENHLFFICGHYEGIDDRIFQLFPITEISIGDYVVTGGSLAAMVILDAVIRQIPGVVGCDASVENDSFYNFLLDCEHYTRPVEFQNLSVPEVLLSGNHKAIDLWRFERMKKITRERRPDLWQEYMKLNINKTDSGD